MFITRKGISLNKEYVQSFRLEKDFMKALKGHTNIDNKKEEHSVLRSIFRESKQ